MGKTNEISARDSDSMLVTTLFYSNSSVTELWDLETLGILDPVIESTKQENEVEVRNHFLKTVSREKDGRYKVRLPWVNYHAPLHDNYDISKKRLDNLMKKLEKDSYYSEYNKVFEEWLDEKIIEEVPEFKNFAESHYLPHRHVVKLNSATTKLRPVFDASARTKNCPSLNQCLEKGLNLIELIPSLLLRFRMGKYGVIADIRKAFLQISLFEYDRNFLKFLWYDKNGKLIVYRHARVVFGVTCSPFLLAAVINFHLEKTLFEVNSGNSNFTVSVVSRLIKSFYVDNCIASLDSIEELEKFIEESRMIMAEAQFDLRLWEYTMLSQVEEGKNVSQVLGLRWDRGLDTLEISFNSNSFNHLLTEKITKKVILSVANSIFDPIGFACPVLLKPKLLLQQTWILKLNWNAEVPDEIKNDFLSWLNNLYVLNCLNISRWLLKDTSNEIYLWELHLFTDASKDAYASAVYLRTQSNNGINVQLVQAKSRVAPLKKISIPRLELLAATIGSKLLAVVVRNFERTDIKKFCWTDSTTVISWIKRCDIWKPFVKNRTDEIRRVTRSEDWYHVPGNFNIADLPSRGCSPQQLIQSCWWEGPTWLKKDRDAWPVQEYEVDEDLVLNEKSKNTTTLLAQVLDFPWYYKYFSKYQQILRLVAWIKRFAFNCSHPGNEKKNDLSLEEIEESEILVLKWVQKESFNGISDDRIASLSPLEDKDGLLRLTTKISRRKDLEDFRYPILLPAKHPVVSRLVYFYHNHDCHVGVQGLLSNLREKFWILGGRKSVKSVISKCMICRKFEARKTEASSVPLPEDRVREALVFEITGIDMAGPLFLRNKEKVWVCIFTCAVYRAVHLELVSSLSTVTFLQAFRRFISRRGRPSKVYSDNGTGFLGTENAFASIDWEKISNYSSVERIIWKFNPPGGPWWGGWWERLIRILKQLLRKVLGKASLNYEELSSVLCECEAVMNSRPLTYISEDVNDLCALTPSMFLQEIRQVGVPDLNKAEASVLRKRCQYKKRLTEDLKRRFRTEYLGSLKLKNKKIKVNIKVGDLVLIENDSMKRTEWPLGRIEKVFPGEDGNVRLVQVKTAKSQLLRPTQKVYLLEMHEETADREIVLDKVKVNKEPDSKSEEKSSKVVYTRYGRKVQPPERLNLR